MTTTRRPATTHTEVRWREEDARVTQRLARSNRRGGEDRNAMHVAYTCVHTVRLEAHSAHNRHVTDRTDGCHHSEPPSKSPSHAHVLPHGSSSSPSPFQCARPLRVGGGSVSVRWRWRGCRSPLFAGGGGGPRRSSGAAVSSAVARRLIRAQRLNPHRLISPPKRPDGPCA